MYLYVRSSIHPETNNTKRQSNNLTPSSSVRVHAGTNSIPFSCEDLLNALIAMFITVPSFTCVAAAATFNICVPTLARNQSQIALKLVLEKNSALFIRDHILRKHTVESATIFPRLI